MKTRHFCLIMGLLTNFHAHIKECISINRGVANCIIFRTMGDVLENVSLEDEPRELVGQIGFSLKLDRGMKARETLIAVMRKMLVVASQLMKTGGVDKLLALLSHINKI